MQQRIIVFLLVFVILGSCSAPNSQPSTKRDWSDLPPIPEKVIYYHSYKEICNTVWETEDKKLRVVFGSAEKDVQVTYEDQVYLFDPSTFMYSDGIFTMESQIQRAGSYLWTLVFVMVPENKTEAYYNMFSGGPIRSKRGTLKLIQ